MILSCQTTWLYALTKISEGKVEMLCAMAKHGKAWQGDVKGGNSVLETDRQTQSQVQVLSCAFAAKNFNFRRSSEKVQVRSSAKCQA